jgi:hypothetical protein
MISQKRSDSIRKSIGELMWEVSVFQTQGNDEGVERTEAAIKKARCKLKLVEDEENKLNNERVVMDDY